MTVSLHALRNSLDGALIATDFDGTLAPIVSTPSDARPVRGVVDILTALARHGARVAVVTGRECSVVLELGGLDVIPGLVVYGLHGAQKWHGGHLTTMEPPAGLDLVRTALPALTGTFPGVWVEDKHLGLVVHTRRAAEPDAALRALRLPVHELATTHGLEMHLGKQVLEIRIPHVSKADSLRELLRTDTTAALFAGDDLGDVGAIAAVKAWGRHAGRPTLTVAVGEVEMLRDAADLRVLDPHALASLLGELLDGTLRGPLA